MTKILVIGVFVLILYECFNFPINYKYEYIAEYGGEGPSLLLSGLLGICSFLLWLMLRLDSLWSALFLLAFVFLVTANVYWIFSEMKRTTAPTGERIKFVICQIIFAVGIFGVLFFLCGAFSSAGNQSNKKKKK